MIPNKDKNSLTRKWFENFGTSASHLISYGPTQPFPEGYFPKLRSDLEKFKNKNTSGVKRLLLKRKTQSK